MTSAIISRQIASCTDGTTERPNADRPSAMDLVARSTEPV